ncbi:enoyl-CoA hydratase/isomerase family protein [Natrarchaeobaculum aegyptiacum]|uniref:Enoyl-CoA hydratase n=1 Tax=Natrarchaeobaculum aegyptiacum TaxID=745377 RepID=A0A2Z2HY24_9EURY|nr:enoyl-CoA hydratase-related protein [Natrarchaeobaculum aegyptiacum]ARS90627.1 enoyl-CoA hydratase [Natrarchaeobaculum aegyptiacum]
MTDAETLSSEDLAVSVSDDDLVVRATIDRPDRRNALNDGVIRGLSDVLEAADAGPTRVVVIRGAGGTFCSGGDLQEFPIGQGTQAYRENFGALSGLIERLQRTSALTVAAVEGHCLAGGLGLATACEFVLASDDASFGTPEVDVGLFPAQAMAPITRAATEKAALKLLFTGEHVDAAEAREMGLVTDVVAAEAFEADLESLVDTLAANSPVLIEMGKEAYYEQRDMDVASALAYLKEVIAMIAMSEDTEEGIDAFLTDREPDWRGR